MKTVTIISSLIIYSTLAENESNIQEKWTEFKTTYKKSYVTPEEEAQRIEIFKRNLKKIEKHNTNYERREVSYRKAVNRFGDMTKAEFAALVKIDGRLAIPRPHGRKNQPFVPSKNKTLTLPFEIDWRSRGVVGRVKDQEQCGSCWSFSAVAAIESQLAIKQGHLTHLSEQNLVDCSSSYDNQGCFGGSPSWAYDYVSDRGLASENDYPYKAEDGECQVGVTSVTKITGYYDLPPGSESWLQYFVGVKGPVSVCIHAVKELQFYGGGVFADALCSTYHSNHCVLVVGYGVDDRGVDYWIVKNSWGTDWGLGGYFYLARNAGNMCAIARGPTFPFL